MLTVHWKKYSSTRNKRGDRDAPKNPTDLTCFEKKVKNTSGYSAKRRPISYCRFIQRPQKINKTKGARIPSNGLPVTTAKFHQKIRVAAIKTLSN